MYLKYIIVFHHFAAGSHLRGLQHVKQEEKGGIQEFRNKSQRISARQEEEERNRGAQKGKKIKKSKK